MEINVPVAKERRGVKRKEERKADKRVEVKKEDA